MTNITRKITGTVAAALVLLAATACSGVQGKPNMVDYSYVPSPQTITVATTPGIESY